MAIHDSHVILLKDGRKIACGHCFRSRGMFSIFGIRCLRLPAFQVRHNGHIAASAHALERNSRTDFATTKNQ